MKLSENDGTEKRRERRGGDGGGKKRQVGQPMQILPEQRANQGGRQPLQRSGQPLVTGGGGCEGGNRGASEGMEEEGISPQETEDRE